MVEVTFLVMWNAVGGFPLSYQVSLSDVETCGASSVGPEAM